MDATGPFSRIVVGLLLAVAGARGALAEPPARVTAFSGDVRVAGSPTDALRAPIGAEEPVETGANAKLSLLFADDVVVDLCSDTLVRPRDPRSFAGLHAERGRLRAYVGPRPGEAPLEISTPTAIATILGTIVHVDVDPETGATTFFSEDHAVRVRNADPGVAGEVTICCGQQVTVLRGKPPGRVTDLRKRDGTQASGCFEQSHDAALSTDRVADEAERLDSMARDDDPRRRGDPNRDQPPANAVDPDPCYASGCSAGGVDPDPGEDDDSGADSSLSGGGAAGRRN
jgi:hypothetical protein